MNKETQTNGLLNFKMVGVAVLEQVGIVSIPGLALVFLLNIWVRATTAYSVREQLTIVIITVISAMIFRIVQTARRM